MEQDEMYIYRTILKVKCKESYTSLSTTSSHKKETDYSGLKVGPSYTKTQLPQHHCVDHQYYSCHAKFGVRSATFFYENAHA
jgi:hypothetical protein